MKKNKLMRMSALALSGLVFLTACGGGKGSNNQDLAKNKEQADKMSMVATNEGKRVDNAEPLTIGMLGSDPLKGQFNPVFGVSADEFAPMEYSMMGAFPNDELYRVEQDNENAMFKYHLDRENKKFTITVHKDLKWNNGEPVTADDIIATYNLMGNPNFTDNMRYDQTFEVINGMKEYHEGKADSISGIKKLDDRNVEISVSKVSPSMLWGDGLIYEFLNKKQIEATDLTKFWEAEMNTKPLSYGAYYIDKNNNGESILFKANPYYYKGEAKNKEFKMVLVPTAHAIEKIKAGEVDIIQVATYDFPRTKELTNGKIIGRDPRSFSYIGFRLGDFKDGKNVTDPNSKLADINLRKAIAMSIDSDAINKKFYHGIGQTPTGSGLYPPARHKIYNENGQRIKFDVEGAKKLLDESGYKDVDGDGFREDKNGKKLVIQWALTNSGSDLDEPISQFYLQSLKNVGINTKLINDKLMSPKEYSERIRKADNEIDMFTGGWALGSSPDPTDLLSATSSLNYCRYTSDAIDKAIAKVHTDDVFDENKMVQAYRELDEKLAEELFWIPTRWGKELYFVNNRVSKWSIDPFDKEFLTTAEQVANLDLLAEKPVSVK